MKPVLLIIFCLVWLTVSIQGTKNTLPCLESLCKIEDNCRCSSNKNPISKEKAPQLIALTVDESVVGTTFNSYLRPLLFSRKNPDGNLIGATFFVPHEYTDYVLVQELYTRGFEIGVHSVTKNSSQDYWRRASLETLTREFEDQKTIISTFSVIPREDIIGGRTPQLQLQGDNTVKAYQAAGLTYENSWATLSKHPLFPYTFNYESTQECPTVITCPKSSFPGFWIVPLSDIRGNQTECNSLATCMEEGTADQIADWLLGEVNRVRKQSKSPLVLRLDSYWFLFTENSYDGFVKFLDRLQELDDVFLVSVRETIDWLKNPVPASKFKTATYDRSRNCNEVTCKLQNNQGQDRYMRSCVQCPQVYPWLGNPSGKA